MNINSTHINTDTLKEIEKLKQENNELKKLLAHHNISINNLLPNQNTLKQSTTNDELSIEEKIKLYRSLFHGREDVYAKRWEAKNGRAGYSPACTNEWNRPICQKPKIKCNECENRKLIPITNQLVYNHLKGNNFIGIYPLLEDETCQDRKSVV